MLRNPNIVIDVPTELLAYESPKFIEHRHDQAVLSCIIYSANKNYKLKVIPEQSERLRKSGQPIHNSRISDNDRRSSINYTPLYKLLIRDLLIVPFRRMRMWYLRNL